MAELDLDLEEPLTCDVVAEIVGSKTSLVVRLAEEGLLESFERETVRLVPRRSVIRMRKMQRLRRDLGVNFAGASVILDLVNRIQEMEREIARLKQS